MSDRPLRSTLGGIFNYANNPLTLFGIMCRPAPDEDP